MELYLETTNGSFTIDDAFSLLADVAQTPPQAQSPTQWSIVYDITSGKVNIVMGRKYDGAIHTLRLSSSS
jgi:hypothetical protein